MLLQYFSEGKIFSEFFLVNREAGLAADQKVGLWKGRRKALEVGEAVLQARSLAPGGGPVTRVSVLLSLPRQPGKFPSPFCASISLPVKWGVMAHK